MPRMFRVASSSLLLVLVVAVGCGPTDEQFRQSVADDMHDALRVDLQRLVTTAQQLEDAAPVTPGRGWDPQQDADALVRMRAAWVRARDLYEHVEGAVEPLAPALNASLDSRYEDVLAQLGPDGDPYPFDDAGIVGLDAVERILWADGTPPAVVAFEATLPGARPAAFPSTEQEASDFKTKLCARLVADFSKLSTRWSTSALDIDGAYAGLVSLVAEQRSELDRATANTVESRYSQRTMADLRANLEGVEAIYGLFRPWLATKGGGDAVDADIEAGFARVDDVYAHVVGDALPPPPATWDPTSPSAADLQTAYGQLYEGLAGATDPSRSGTVVSRMNDAAALMSLR
jgi:hypothetical protein